jgi:Fuc2NAc and GlcNAc transferase
MVEYMLAAVVLMASIVLTAIFRNYALKRSLLDLPAARSSHMVPTPRGGGLSIVLTFIAAILVLFAYGRMSLDDFMALFVGGSLVAGIGFWDDHGHIPARWRILVHFAAAAWVVWWLGGVTSIALDDRILDIGWLGSVFATVLLVWLLNLYNFMDGIDGIAGVETVCVAGGAALMLFAEGEQNLSLLLGLLICSSLGFLVWNWPPAKVFMGDAGSGFLGFVLGVFALLTSVSGALPLWSWLILLAVFVVDATTTLMRRILRGERWYEAHRSHAYQHAAQHYQSHLKVTAVVCVINVVWLLPLAWYASMRPEMGLVLVCVAFGPLVVLALKFGAGKPVFKNYS